MKTIIITGATLIVLAQVAQAQKVKESEVPKAILESFTKNFKNIKAEKWEKEKDGTYEAEFDVNKTETSASFNLNGELLATETEIKVNELPKTITGYVSSNYSGYKISEAAKIIDNKGVTTYEAELEKGKEEFDLLFDASGNFLKKEMDAGIEEDKE